MKLSHSLEATTILASTVTTLYLNNYVCAYPLPARCCHELNSSLFILVFIDNYQKFTKPYVKVLEINKVSRESALAAE